MQSSAYFINLEEVGIELDMSFKNKSKISGPKILSHKILEFFNFLRHIRFY